ncbi:hypothetical protein ENSA5_06080 [Enhygromyxa salina]|uniref:Secreted protein n=1 Tax=Enhygromyxa salina TaxID=215803 RepID=A0A2S9YHY2_9BACT|nr:hypothetical protein [Enhygromyxa salina]PRQ04652.1 hypothetical protein ENSA5_06080 [Enhygromyxa salina]
MTPATSRVCVFVSTAALVALAFAASACDDDAGANKGGDRRSVVEGGKAESAPGKKLEHAKEQIEEAEKKMEDADADRFERSAGEKVERGLP